MKKLVSLVLALAMILTIGAAFAQTVSYTGADKDAASITIVNAAKGETYSVVKLFDATVTDKDGGSIAYQGDIPSELASIFVKDAATGEITYTGTGNSLTATESAALKTWAEGQNTLISAVSDGSKLVFDNLPFGYYVVLTTQGAGAVTVTNTNRTATVKDKNTTTITGEKKVGKESYSIGDTITYTATFGTTNFNGEYIVTKYEISDTLPDFLSNVAITSVKVFAKDGTTLLADLSSSYTAFDANKKITIPWADEVANSNPKEFVSKYANGAKIVITYTARLTSVTNINTADTNTISIKPYYFKDTETPWDEPWNWDATIKTYGVAIHKVDENGYDLAGAEFSVKGLTVTPGDAQGEYIVVTYDPNSTTESESLKTNDKGYLYIVGFASDAKLTFTETKAPDGYNKLAAPVTNVQPQLMTTALYTQSGEIKYDAKGNVIGTSQTPVKETKTVQKNLTDLDAAAVEIVNQKGTELPSTGGIGTTIFYILGGLLVVGAAVILVARRRVKE